jgi:hypothetical protein
MADATPPLKGPQPGPTQDVAIPNNTPQPVPLSKQQPPPGT